MMSDLGKILIVDDELELKNILVESLAGQGYTTTGFTRGDQALELLRDEPFDILLTDLMMPEMDGITLVREARNIDPNLICIMMTGQGTIQTAVDAMKGGTFDYVLKPFRLQTMLPMLTRAMNTRHLLLENIQLREAVAIHELCQTIAFTLDGKTILSKLADAALLQSEADEVSVLLPAADAEEFYVAAVRGEKRERLLGERIPFGASVSSWVAREHEPLILNGEIDDDRFVSLWPRPEIRSSVSIPMLISKKLVGVLNLNMIKRRRSFTLGQMKALTILAGTAAAALQSATLHKQVVEAEENYRSIFEHAANGIFRATPDGRRFISVNPSMARMFGYESPEQMVAAVTDVTQELGLDPQRREEAMATLGAAGHIDNFEAAVLRKNGEEIWINADARAVKGSDGAFVYIDGIVQDITIRRRAEEAVRASEAEMRALFASMTDVILVLGHDGTHLKVAPTRTPSMYVPAAERIGKTLHEIFPKKNADFFLNHIQLSLEKGETQRVEYSLTIHGHDTWFDASVSPLTDTSVIWVARDITERKRAEAALRESEQRYRDIIENARDIIYSHDFKGHYTAMNQAGGEITGYSVEEALKLSTSDTVAPEFLAKATEMTQRKLAGENVTAYEIEITARDGRRIPVEVNTWLMYENGAPVGVTGIARDITQRREAEAEMRFQSSLLEAQNEASIDGILVVSPEAEILSYNRRFLELWGLSENQIADKSDRSALQSVMDQLVTPEEFLDRVQYLYDHPDETSQEEVQLKDGRVFDRHSAPVHGPGGEYYGRVWYFHDITERKKAQAELSRLAAAVQQTADSIVITDPEGAIEYVNPAFEAITGYSMKEALGQNPRILKSDKNDPVLYTDLWETITRGDVWEGQLVNRRKDGTLFTERATISAVRDASGKIVHYVAVKKDMTHEIQLEDQLRQSQKMEAIGQLAGGVAHDFNNLLTAINGYSTLALQRVEDGSSIKPYLEEVKKAGDRAANLTRQLLAFGRKQILQPLPLDLNNTVSDMNKMLRRLIGEDIVLTAKLAANLKKIKADPGQIEQVLVNLVVNARDAMPTGGHLTIETANVELDQDYAARHVGIRPGQYVMLAVSDTGLGMDEATRARIFEPFFTTKEKGKGTGLGLSTVYGIVQQSGGSIWVYSEPNQGTAFKVYLPELITEQTADAPRASHDELIGGSETILLVEDEDVVRGLTTSILEGVGYKVIPAHGGAEATELWADYQEEIDLLLTDVVMPETSGKEVADRLTEMQPRLKVLFMSGYTDESIVQHGVLDESVQFIQKPFTPVALSRKVREVLDRNGHHHPA